jgi:hypothetical protein
LRDLVFIADHFVDAVVGGGELNNEEFIKIVKRSRTIKKINSHFVTLNFLEQNSKSFFIIANFLNLKQDLRDYISDKIDYVIYEHDHKYITNRNPAEFKDFIAPKEMIINYDFYQKAKAIFCQSEFHSDIVKKNLNLENVVNLSGNIWSSDSLDLMEKLSHKEKKNRCSIMNSEISHKNTKEAILFCKYKNLEYELIQPSPYDLFLDKLSNNDKLIFFPKTPETLSRIVVEARMMGMTTITNKIIGAVSEKWFSLKGKELIDHMREKREIIAKTVLNSI